MCSEIPHVCLTNRRSLLDGREEMAFGKEEKVPVSTAPQKEYKHIRRDKNTWRMKGFRNDVT